MDYDSNRLNDFTNTHTSQNIKSTFQAFVDAIIPRTPDLAEEFGPIQYYGALNFQIDEYLIMQLNVYDPDLVKIVAELLDIAAERLLYRKENKQQPNYVGAGSFSALAPEDRLMALALLRNSPFDPSYISYPIDHEFFYIIEDLIRFTVMGYYSEWFGYGTTRLYEPNDRILEFYPLSWKQISYPGPTPAYNFNT